MGGNATWTFLAKFNFKPLNFTDVAIPSPATSDWLVALAWVLLSLPCESNTCPLNKSKFPDRSGAIALPVIRISPSTPPWYSPFKFKARSLRLTVRGFSWGVVWVRGKLPATLTSPPLNLPWKFWTLRRSKSNKILPFTSVRGASGSTWAAIVAFWIFPWPLAWNWAIFPFSCSKIPEMSSSILPFPSTHLIWFLVRIFNRVKPLSSMLTLALNRLLSGCTEANGNL